MLASTLRVRVLLPLLFLAACSSEEQTGGPPTDAGLPFSAGDLTGTTLGGTGAPVTTSGSGALITGIPGQFTSLRYRSPGGETAGAYVYFTMRDSSEPSHYSHIWRIGINGAGLRRLTSDTLYQLSPSVSPDGSQVVYSQWDGKPGRENTEDIWRMQSDGSGRTVIGFKFETFDNFAWTADGQRIIYAVDNDEDGPGLASISPVPGVQGQQLTNSLDFSPTYGVIDSEPSVLFERDGSLWRIVLATLDTSVYLTDSTSYLLDPRLSPDSRRLLFRRLSRAGGASELVMTTTAAPRANENELFSLSPDFTGFEWVPDGKHAVVGMSLSPGESPQMYEINPDSMYIPGGGRFRLITRLTGALRPGFSIGRAAAVQSRQLIGPTAPLGDSASGIVFGQGAGGTLTSVVAFHAITPDSVTLSAETGLNSTSPVLSVSLRADRLTGLGFLNDLAGPVTEVVDNGGGQVNGAIITFDATTGAVALVLPYTLEGGSVPPTIEDQGATRVFHGHFLGVYGADGVDRGQGAVTEVRLNPRGNVIRFSR